MTSHDAHELRLEQILDSRVLDAEGRRLGEVTQVLLDDLTGQPTWVRVATGLLRSRQATVPLHGALLGEGTLTLAHTRAQVAQAPSGPSGADQEGLTPELERALMEHYGLVPSQEEGGSSVTPGTTGTPHAQDGEG